MSTPENCGVTSGRRSWTINKHLGRCDGVKDVSSERLLCSQSIPIEQYVVSADHWVLKQSAQVPSSTSVRERRSALSACGSFAASRIARTA